MKLMKRIISLLAVPLFFTATAIAAGADTPLRDKTLVVWAAPANLTQRGGSVLTIDDGQGAMRRVYPTRPDSVGVSLFSQGGAMKVRQVKAWKMNPSNPY
jgi:hypothetical protein